MRNPFLLPIKKQNNDNIAFTIMLLGFLVFSLSEMLDLLYHPLKSISAIIGLGMVFITPFFYQIKLVQPLQGKIRIIFNLYLFWVFFIIVRPLVTIESYSEQTFYLYQTYGFTSYLLFLIVYLGVDKISFSKILTINTLSILIGILYFIFNFNNMLEILNSNIFNSSEEGKGINNLANEYYILLSTANFAILCYTFLSKKQRIITICANLFLLFLMIYFARRGGVAMSLIYFLGAFFLSLNLSKGNTKIIKFIFILSIIIVAIITVNMYSDSIFSLWFDRMDDDTRSGVDVSIINYLNNENAWLFGKGIEGAYPHSGYLRPRYVHETGYLYLILKGGIVFLVLYCTLLLHAAYVGFFKTNNHLTKALALYMLFHIAFLIPFGLPSFSLEYLLVWISFLFCESKQWRSFDNEHIKSVILKNKS